MSTVFHFFIKEGRAMSHFRNVQIDFDVHRQIELYRQGFDESPNDVLRRLLKIEGKRSSEPVSASSRETTSGDGDSSGQSWRGKGVELPHGTKLRMKYNRRTITGEIDNGEWRVGGRAYTSPSAAAIGSARTRKGERPQLSGWRYWSVKRPSDANWIHISQLRPAR